MLPVVGDKFMTRADFTKSVRKYCQLNRKAMFRRRNNSCKAERTCGRYGCPGGVSANLVLCRINGGHIYVGPLTVTKSVPCNPGCDEMCNGQKRAGSGDTCESGRNEKKQQQPDTTTASPENSSDCEDKGRSPRPRLYAVRKGGWINSRTLKAPAIFLDVGDYNEVVDPKVNQGDVEAQSFVEVGPAIEFVTRATSLGRLHEPPSFYAVRRCNRLNGAAIFMGWNDANPIDYKKDYKCFHCIRQALQYIEEKQIGAGVKPCATTVAPIPTTPQVEEEQAIGEEKATERQKKHKESEDRTREENRETKLGGDDGTQEPSLQVDVTAVAARLKFRFFEGEENIMALATVGRVYDVTGDGNCGIYTTILGLGVIGVTRHPRTNKAMRRHIHKLAGELKAEMFDTVSEKIFPYMDETEREQEWKEMRKDLYGARVKYDDEDYMKAKGEDGSYANTRHWMDSALALPIISREYRVRIILYATDVNEAYWMTHVFDGRDGRFNISVTDGVVRTPPGDRTFGLHYTGEHYQYVQLK
jgi:hypothetical protein